MNQERIVGVVRTLTKEVMEALRPEKLATFSDDFAASTIGGGILRVEESAPLCQSRDQTLDTTLVAGMFFQVLREAEKLPVSTPERVSFIRRQAKSYLATRLAGQIPLSQFFRLLNLIEENAQSYFEDARGSWVRPKTAAAKPPEPEAPAPGIRADALRQALETLPLGPNGRRKLTSTALEDFLRETRGGWFRLLDFEARFEVNKKTAWSYLTQLLQSGILEHNGEKANKVRYMVASSLQRL
jgi:hypothetical protein